MTLNLTDLLNERFYKSLDKYTYKFIKNPVFTGDRLDTLAKIIFSLYVRSMNYLVPENKIQHFTALYGKM